MDIYSILAIVVMLVAVAAGFMKRFSYTNVLVVANLDSTPEEFEMKQLAIEKVIPGGTRARIRVRPLGPGRYGFIGDFHKDLAHGTLISE